MSNAISRAQKKSEIVIQSHFFPPQSFPQIKLEDFLKQAATDIITLLTNPPSTTTPSLEAGDPVRNALFSHPT